MKITRQGHTFDVVDDPATRAWNFWEDQFASGKWEPETLRVIEETLQPEHTYIDIGAWVGPCSLWAASRGADVVAVEPDPTAHGVLFENLATNHPDRYIVINSAVADSDAGRLLKTHGAWGDSMSTTVAGLDRAVDEIPVPSVAFDDLVRRWADGLSVSLVKIDIEGAEGEVIPSAARTLKALHCPVILALHRPWIADPDAVESLIHDLFTVTVLEDHPAFPTLLLEP